MDTAFARHKRLILRLFSATADPPMAENAYSSEVSESDYSDLSTWAVTIHPALQVREAVSFLTAGVSARAFAPSGGENGGVSAFLSFPPSAGEHFALQESYPPDGRTGTDAPSSGLFRATCFAGTSPLFRRACGEAVRKRMSY